MHEIGYLLLQFSLQCWFWSNPECVAANKSIKLYDDTRTKVVRTISRSEAKSIDGLEVGYEQYGFRVFKKKNNWYQVQTKDKKKFWVGMESLNKDFGIEKAISYSKIEEIIGQNLLYLKSGAEAELRQSDLVTQIERGQKKSSENPMKALLNNYGWKVPVGFFDIKNKCTYVKKGNGYSGSCGGQQGAVFKQPNQNKIMDASVSSGHLTSVSVGMDTLENPFTVDRVMVFEKREDWVKVRLDYNSRNIRYVWLDTSKLKNYTYTPIKEEKLALTLTEFLEFRYDDQEFREAIKTFDPKNAKRLGSNEKLHPESTGKTKWKNGLLWVEVILTDIDGCSGDSSPNPSVSQKGWIPFNKLGWYSRGC